MWCSSCAGRVGRLGQFVSLLRLVRRSGPAGTRSDGGISTASERRPEAVTRTARYQWAARPLLAAVTAAYELRTRDPRLRNGVSRLLITAGAGYGKSSLLEAQRPVDGVV